MAKRGCIFGKLAAGSVLLLGLLLPAAVFGQNVHSNAPSPIGAWFGVARPCSNPSVPDPNPDSTICEIAGDQGNNFPLGQVTMIPTLLGDGTVLADDFAELVDGHTTAQGKWEYAGRVKVDGKWLDKYQATFIWFSNLGFVNPLNFAGSVRPRFVTFFDKDNPDEMRGYIQPYVYPYAAPSGLVNFDGKFPSPNPTDPLPTTCDPNAGGPVPCLGTLHFYIRRILAH
jgi:hypothetical protein